MSDLSRPAGPAAAAWAALCRSRKMRCSAAAFLSLLAYLVVRQIAFPGYTYYYWGYLALQTAAILVALLAGEAILFESGGLSWQTHVLSFAIASTDVVGNVADLYPLIPHFDKALHFLGITAVTAGAYDLLGVRLAGRPAARALAAAAVGLAVGIGWEAYEYVADQVFGTSRIRGGRDTAGDIVFDALGAAVTGALYWWGRRVQPRERAGLPSLRGGDGP